LSESTTLVAVAGGETYVRFAEQLMESAREFFHPTPQVDYLILDGEEGWPQGTLMRYHRLLREEIKTDYLFMIDADMLCVAPIGSEILHPDEDAIVVTTHPGYVDRPSGELPFENRPESSCYVKFAKRRRYVCGGFVGGERREFQYLAQRVMKRLDEDIARGITPLWNDESALNAAVVAYLGYKRVLSPAYCYPQDSSYYEREIWTERYEPRIVALDKTPAERALTGR
jgi:Glycosyltransferase family 6